jgi:DNA-directed RNA polymerase specialized sigma24 family protein
LVTLQRTTSKPIRVRYERDGSGWQAHARVKGETVVITARTLEAARSAMATAVAPLLNTYASNVPLDDAVALPDECTAAIAAARAARSASVAAAAHSQELLRAAALLLVVEQGLSYRDAAYALGISHARIQQILGKERTRT